MPKLTKIDQIQFTLLQLSHLSSNRRVCNLPLYFQFTTPAKSSPTEQNLSDPERHKFQKHHVSSLPEAREMPKILPRKTQILATPKFFATLSQRIAKTNHERHEFCTKLHSLTPAKMPRKVFSFPEFRTSLQMHSLTPTILTKQQLGNT